MQCTIVRRAEFSASHRYWLPELSEAENQARFGLCQQFPGHGHNYVLDVSVTGKIDEYGMVMNLSDVKRILKREVVTPLNFSYLNNAWPEFAKTLPTTENMARVIWQRLAPHLPLTKVQLFESPYLWAEYFGNFSGNPMEAFLTISTHFSAAHRLAHPDLSQAENDEIYGLCARPHGHGHNYHLEVTVRGEIDPRTGMLVDLVALEGAIDKEVVKPFDHTFLNYDIPYFATVVPTAENIAAYIYDLLKGVIAQLGASLYKIKVIESPNNSAEVYATTPVEIKQQQAFLASVHR